MIRPFSTRRDFLAGLTAAAALPCLPAVAAPSMPRVHVLKDPLCGCCGAWVEILRADRFAVTVEEAGPDRLAAIKRASGVPVAMASCHTARVSGYVIEGHVPPADIRRMLSERPDAIGLAVPGMPYGSPGMGPEDEREGYAVYLIGRDGTATVYARYAAAR